MVKHVLFLPFLQKTRHIFAWTATQKCTFLRGIAKENQWNLSQKECLLCQTSYTIQYEEEFMRVLFKYVLWLLHKNHLRVYCLQEIYQALLWWIFQMGKFLLEKATLWVKVQSWNMYNITRKRIERHRLSGYKSLGLRKHLDEPRLATKILY